MKKTKALDQEQKDRLDNFIVIATAAVLIAGVVLAVVYNYINSIDAQIVAATRVFLNILQWAGLAAVAVFAVWGAVKKNGGMFKFSGMGAALSLGAFLVLRLGTRAGFLKSGVALTYYGLGLYLVGSYVYYALVTRRRWGAKGVRAAFYAVFGVLAAALLALMVWALVF